MRTTIYSFFLHGWFISFVFVFTTRIQPNTSFRIYRSIRRKHFFFMTSPFRIIVYKNRITRIVGGGAAGRTADAAIILTNDSRQTGLSVDFFFASLYYVLSLDVTSHLPFHIRQCSFYRLFWYNTRLISFLFHMTQYTVAQSSDNFPKRQFPENKIDRQQKTIQRNYYLLSRKYNSRIYNKKVSLATT